jgi:glycosyltransferase involved in cell wall biosynthesis
VRAIDTELASGGWDVTIELVAPRGVAPMPHVQHLEQHCGGRLQGPAWEQLDLPRLSGQGLLLGLGNTGPMLRHSQLVVIHDASVYAHPEAYSRRFVMYYRALLWTMSRRAQRILTVSEFSRRELQSYLHIPESRFAVVHEGCEHVLREPSEHAILGRLGVEPGQYVLGVSTTQPYKNLGRLVQAFEHLSRPDIRLVLVGSADPKVFVSQNPGVPEGVVLAGRVSDGELRALYENAAALVFPSLYEGFGLPPLEAMACGCPVVVSHAASLPEVCGGAALYCDALDEQSIAGQLARLLDNGELRERMIRFGHKRAAEFTWQRCAREVLSLVEVELVQ